MNVHYTGRHAELSEAQKKKLEPKFDKVHRILGTRHAPEAHVIVSAQRGRYAAEVTLNLWHHTLVVECTGPGLFSVVQEAIEKLEKQVIRNKDKLRERKRRAKPVRETEEEREPGPARSAAGPPRLYRARAPVAKPLTVEEAVLEMEQDDRDCVVYRDARNGHMSVLFRRRDGNLVLFEA